MLGQKNFQIKINSTIDFVFLRLSDLHRELATFLKKVFFDGFCLDLKKLIYIGYLY